MTAHQLRYVPRVPMHVPAGTVLVHNSVYPVARLNGTRGSRMWLSPKSYVRGWLEVCPCGWAPELKRHYRVK